MMSSLFNHSLHHIVMLMEWQTLIYTFICNIYLPFTTIMASLLPSCFSFPLFRKSNAEALSITALSHPYLCEDGLIFNPGRRGGDGEKENKEERSEWSGTCITSASIVVNSFVAVYNIYLFKYIYCSTFIICSLGIWKLFNGIVK